MKKNKKNKDKSSTGYIYSDAYGLTKEELEEFINSSSIGLDPTALGTAVSSSVNNGASSVVFDPVTGNYSVVDQYGNKTTWNTPYYSPITATPYSPTSPTTIPFTTVGSVWSDEDEKRAENIEFFTKIKCYEMKKSSIKKRDEFFNYFIASLPKSLSNEQERRIIKAVVTNLKMSPEFLIKFASAYDIITLETCGLYDFNSQDYSAVKLYYSMGMRGEK